MSHYSIVVHMGKEAYDDGYLDIMMGKYYENTDNKDYLEFIDETDDVVNGFENGTGVAIALPDDEKVYRSDKLPKGYKINYEKTAVSYSKDDGENTKTIYGARIFKAPNKVLYDGDIDKFAKEWFGYEKEYERYGYYANPNAFFDYYTIGGRWNGNLRVNDDGIHKNVDVAQKKDILWGEMGKIAKKEIKIRYEEYKKIFNGEKVIEEGLKICDDGLYGYGTIPLYKNGESFDDFLKRNNSPCNEKYPISMYGFINEGGYVSKDDSTWIGTSKGDNEDEKWINTCQKYIEDIPEDDIIIFLDCHS